MIRGLVLPCAMSLILGPLSAQADTRDRTRNQGPCAGCVSSLPGGSDLRPLLVLLHGDGESASAILDAWEPGAAARGLAVLALACPRSEGCARGSFWRWNGDPSWVLDQTLALAESRAFDRERMWIVGWSGGGSYIGFRTQEFEQAFAGILIHGGGMPPPRSKCPRAKAAVYFLVGDMNPLHDLAVRLRDHYESCGDDVTWTLLKGADHEGERRALASHREAILDWFSTKRLTEPLAANDAVVPKASDPPTSAPSASATPAIPASPSPSCRCGFAGVAPSVAHVPLLGPALVAALALARRRRRTITDRAPALR